MTDRCRLDLDRTEIEHLIQEEKYREAKAYLSRRGDRFPFDREARLYLLLVNVGIHGPECFEDDINELRTLFPLSHAEKNIVRRIFLLGYRAAETRGQENQTWAYQRLLRRLLLDEPLDQTIPKTSKRPFAGVGHTLVELDPEMRVATREFEIAQAGPTFHPRFAQLAPIPRSARHASLMVATIGFLAIPIVYLFFGQTKKTTWQAVASNHRALPAATENGVGIANSEMIEHPRKKIFGDREETLQKRATAQLPNLRHSGRRRIAKNHELAGSPLPKLGVDGTDQVTQVNKIATPLPDADLVNAVTRQAHQGRFPNDSVDSAEVAVPLLSFSKETDPGSTAHGQGTLNDAQTKKNAPASVQIARSSPLTHKGRKLKNQAQHADALTQKIAATAGNRAHAPEPANAIMIAKTRHRITLREEPRFAATGVKQLGGGVSVHVLEVRGRWLKVESADAETVGFVRKEFLIPTD